MLETVKTLIQDVPDFPKPGIVFKDITPLLADHGAMDWILQEMAQPFAEKVDVVCGIESRGFILGAALARQCGLGFIPMRKKGRLPRTTVSESYDLEYGQDTLELHEDAVQGKKVLVVDDVLATGGTAAAAARLVNKAGGDMVGMTFLMELEFLHGREKLPPTQVHALLKY